MKLKELMIQLYDDNIIRDMNAPQLGMLHGKPLKLFKDKILECDEFKTCTKLNIVDLPAFLDNEEQSRVVSSMKIGDNINYDIGECYLYSINLTPEIFDLSKHVVIINNKGGITPIIYDPISFNPRRLLVLNSRVDLDDLLENKTEFVRELLHKNLDEMLDNPEQHLFKGDKYVIVRGYFPNLKTTNND